MGNCSDLRGSRSTSCARNIWNWPPQRRGRCSPNGVSYWTQRIVIAKFAEDMSRFLLTSDVTEPRALIPFTIPISQSTTKTSVLVGGRSEEFRVGNDPEASSHLVWDVEGGLHPEERPRVGLWLSEQFLLPADVFLQSFSSTPTVRPRQHVAIGLGNAVRELAVPAQVSGLW